MVVTSVFIFVGRFGIETLEEDPDVFVQLVPVTVHHIEDGIVLHLPFLQLFDTLPQFGFGSLTRLESLQKKKHRGRRLMSSLMGLTVFFCT